MSKFRVSIRGEKHTAVVLKVLEKDVHGRPSKVELLHDEQSIEIKGGEVHRCMVARHLLEEDPCVLSPPRQRISGVRVGQRNGRSRLTDAEVVLARQLAALGRRRHGVQVEGWSLAAIARWLGVRYDAVRHAVRGASWTHLETFPVEDTPLRARAKRPKP